MIRLACVAAVLLAVGLVVGRLSADHGVGELRSGARASTVTHVAERPARCARLSTSDVESLKRELVAAVMALQGARPSSEADRATLPMPDTVASLAPDTAESRAADQRLRETVDIAIAAGRWTGEEAKAMRRLMGVASPAATREALSAFAMAVNEQRLEVDPDALFF